MQSGQMVRGRVGMKDGGRGAGAWLSAGFTDGEARRDPEYEETLINSGGTTGGINSGGTGAKQPSPPGR